MVRAKRSVRSTSRGIGDIDTSNNIYNVRPVTGRPLTFSEVQSMSINNPRAKERQSIPKSKEPEPEEGFFQHLGHLAHRYIPSFIDVANPIGAAILDPFTFGMASKAAPLVAGANKQIVDTLFSDPHQAKPHQFSSSTLKAVKAFAPSVGGYLVDKSTPLPTRWANDDPWGRSNEDPKPGFYRDYDASVLDPQGVQDIVTRFASDKKDSLSDYLKSAGLKYDPSDVINRAVNIDPRRKYNEFTGSLRRMRDSSYRRYKDFRFPSLPKPIPNPVEMTTYSQMGGRSSSSRGRQPKPNPNLIGVGVLDDYDERNMLLEPNQPDGTYNFYGELEGGFDPFDIGVDDLVNTDMFNFRSLPTSPMRIRPIIDINIPDITQTMPWNPNRTLSTYSPIKISTRSGRILKERSPSKINRRKRQ